MSRGLGKLQKRILRVLGTKKYKSTTEITKSLYPDVALYRNHCPSYFSDYINVHQAIKSLERRGLIERGYTEIISLEGVRKVKTK